MCADRTLMRIGSHNAPSSRVGGPSTRGGASAFTEALEQRVLFSASAHGLGTVSPTSSPTFRLLGKVSAPKGHGSSSPNATSSPSSTFTGPYAPANIDAAYGISSISFNGASGNGAGQTVAIIDAYNDPDIISDANTFSSQWGLPELNQSGGPSFKVLNQSGGTSLSGVPNAGSTGWDLEESLDVEWVHSVAPEANIILFEANSNSDTNLYAAVKTAAGTTGVSVVSMSWGGSEVSNEATNDSDFSHTGVTFLASTGDSAAPAFYPALSPNVVAVGGTDLTVNSDGSYNSETGWASGGGSVSNYESIPSYQVGKINGLSSTKRAAPDVSIDADPSTGVYVLDSYESGWYEVGGTSLSAQLMAGLVAIANQGRAIYGASPLTGNTQTLPALYNLPGSNFHDITSGNNGYAAGPGYDLVTGVGSPVANQFVPDLAAYGLAETPTIVSTQVGDGSAQRSSVKSVSVTFNEPINLGTGSFTIYQEALTTSNGITSVNTAAPPTDVTSDITATLSNNEQTVTFSVIPGSALDRSGSFDGGYFSNGIYQLVLNGSAITDRTTGTAQFDGGSSTPLTFANSVPGDNGTSNYFGILYGDLFGTGSLNSTDAREFTLAANSDTTDNGYLDYFGTGSLSSTDARQFTKDAGVIYSY